MVYARGYDHNSIPIVFSVGDAVEPGLVASLARPGSVLIHPARPARGAGSRDSVPAISISSETPSAQRKYAQYPGAEQSQCARLGDGRGRDGGKQPVCLNVNSVGDIKRVGATVHAAGPKIEGPKAARRLAAARIDRDHPEKRPGHRVEGVDLAQDVAEIAHQQIIAE